MLMLPECDRFGKGAPMTARHFEATPDIGGRIHTSIVPDFAIGCVEWCAPFLSWVYRESKDNITSAQSAR